MKQITSPSHLSIAALILFSIFALKDLSKPGFYTSHDGENHAARIAQYYNAIGDGQIPPRFAGSFYSGLGSPIFVYIYPLPYALGAAIHATGISYADSFKILMAFGFVFSGIFSFLWLREIAGSEKAAFLGALFYTWVPYRFLLVYVRASLSELLAYTFVPLVFYALTKLSKSKDLRWVAISALSISLVLLSQNLVALITIPVFAVYVLILTVFEKSPKFFILAALSSLWGFLISAITYLPSLLERGYVRFDQIISIAYPNHFVTLKQLIRSPWGYGFDLPGTVNDQMSFQIGLIHILVFLVSLFVSAFLLIKRKDLKLVSLNSFFILAFLAAAFLMVQTKYSLYFWQNYKILQTVDIPWRFLGIVSLSTAFMAAYAAKTLKPGAIFIFLAVLVLFANRNHLRINQSRDLDDQFFDQYTGTATQYNEFTPKWRQTDKAPVDFGDQMVEVEEGSAQILNLSTDSKTTKFNADVKSGSAKIRINKFYFPNVGLMIDNVKNQTFTITDAKNLDLSRQRDTSGLVQIDLEKGSHQVELIYGETTTRQAANYISALALLFAIGTAVKNAKA